LTHLIDTEHVEGLIDLIFKKSKPFEDEEARDADVKKVKGSSLVRLKSFLNEPTPSGPVLHLARSRYPI